MTIMLLSFSLSSSLMSQSLTVNGGISNFTTNKCGKAFTIVGVDLLDLLLEPVTVSMTGTDFEIALGTLVSGEITFGNYTSSLSIPVETDGSISAWVCVRLKSTLTTVTSYSNTLTIRAGSLLPETDIACSAEIYAYNPSVPPQNPDFFTKSPTEKPKRDEAVIFTANKPWLKEDGVPVTSDDLLRLISITAPEGAKFTATIDNSATIITLKSAETGEGEEDDGLWQKGESYEFKLKKMSNLGFSDPNNCTSGCGNSSGGGGGGSGVEDDYYTFSFESDIYTFEEAEAIATSINKTEASKYIDSETIYTLTGIQITGTVKSGVFVKKITYGDGSVKTLKYIAP